MGHFPKIFPCHFYLSNNWRFYEFETVTLPARSIDIHGDSSYYSLRDPKSVNTTPYYQNSMSLGIAFKGPEGIVLAADSRVTLTAQQKAPDGPISLIHSTYDNATKLLHVDGCLNVGVVTYGLGAIGNTQPRTAHSFISELEKYMKKEKHGDLVGDFAQTLSNFFAERWVDHGMPKVEEYQGPDMIFLIAGYDPDAPYGRVFEVQLPRNPAPKEWHKETFGMVWGGQQDIATRLLNGYDPQLMPIIQKMFKKSDAEMQELRGAIDPIAQMPIPYMFLPLQDSINLSILIIETTRTLQSYSIGVRGVGGEIDVATITRSGGFKPYREKSVARLYRREDKEC